jgi:hypothetical protein
VTFRPWISLAGIVAVLAAAFSPAVSGPKAVVATIGVVLVVAIAVRERERLP